MAKDTKSDAGVTYYVQVFVGNGLWQTVLTTTDKAYAQAFHDDIEGRKRIETVAAPKKR